MVAVRDPSELVGAVLNRTWRLTRALGQGGLGLVYEAEGLQGQGKRAIKLLHHELCGEPATVERFIAEALASARLDHAGLTRVYEAQRAEDGTPYLVMELLEGLPLNQLARQGRLPQLRVLEIIRALLIAVAAAHQAGVIHRDLKPENVFVTHEGLVKVLDLGLARVMDAAGGMTRKTSTGMLLGTPGYMSPEQIKDSKRSDLRSDLWSVGVIFYELLTGRQAFGAVTEFARMTAVLTEPLTPLLQVAPEHARWQAFFDRALAKEPQERFQSASEMLSALESVAAGGSLPPPSLGASQYPRTDTAVSPSAAGYSQVSAPQVDVRIVEASARLPSVPLWLTVVLCLACFAAGLLMGVLV